MTKLLYSLSILILASGIIYTNIKIGKIPDNSELENRIEILEVVHNCEAGGGKPVYYIPLKKEITHYFYPTCMRFDKEYAWSDGWVEK